VGRGGNLRGDVPDRYLRRTGARAGGVALALSIVVAALGGCGGGGGDGSSSAASSSAQAPTSTSTTNSAGSLPDSLGSKDAVRTAVEAVLASSDPADACGKYVTQHYLKVAYGGKQGCVQAQAPGSAAKSLRSFRIVNESTQGKIATATAVPNGGPYDGSKVVIGLLFDHDHYRVEALRANVPVGP
jgi:hypothetical protein